MDLKFVQAAGEHSQPSHIPATKLHTVLLPQGDGIIFTDTKMPQKILYDECSDAEHRAFAGFPRLREIEDGTEIKIRSEESGLCEEITQELKTRPLPWLLLCEDSYHRMTPHCIISGHSYRDTDGYHMKTVFLPIEDCWMKVSTLKERKLRLQLDQGETVIFRAAFEPFFFKNEGGKLLVETQEGKTEAEELFYIGKNPGKPEQCIKLLAKSGVSRLHASVKSLGDDVWEITDESANGLWFELTRPCYHALAKGVTVKTRDIEIDITNVGA
eukprot:TRINITY_DN3817_c0_g1_i4.p1 TRINITY_DN3817_c0_g1~~TRINITY_DN3817_c0_g1_i4.p1  ORF type:complete len:271 (-),score=52.13 TRINITY_DN3817_c0_g1_i4:27-839(-)